MRAIVPRQLSSSIRAQPTIDCAVHLVESILCVSVALLHIVTSPNKIVAGTTASKSFTRNLIGLFVSTVRNCWTWPKISQLENRLGNKWDTSFYMFFRVAFCRSNCRSKVHSLLAYELILISLLTSTPRGTTVPFVAVNRGVLQKLTKWMGANKKKPNKMVGLCAPTSSLQHPHILLGGNCILPDVGCLPFSEYILCLHVWVLSPKKCIIL